MLESLKGEFHPEISDKQDFSCFLLLMAKIKAVSA